MVPPQPTRTQGSKLGIGKFGGVNDSTTLDCAWHFIKREGSRGVCELGVREATIRLSGGTTVLGVDLDLVGP